MEPVRILVVDDAVVARRIISDILAAEVGLEVVGTAPNGNLALKKIARLRPDVVTLDIDMPELDGMQTLTKIRSNYPEIRVIMVSNHTRRGAAITVEALFSGASDYVTKAARSSSAEEARTYLRDQLVPKVFALSPTGRTPAPPIRSKLTPPVPLHKPKPIEMVVIGSSTGGPNALTTILETLPADFPTPLLIVQHLPENFSPNASTPCARSRFGRRVDGFRSSPGRCGSHPAIAISRPVRQTAVRCSTRTRGPWSIRAGRPQMFSFEPSRTVTERRFSPSC